MRTCERLGESMTVRRPMAVAVALLCGCILVVAGCDAAGTAVTTITTITSGAATTTETAQLYPISVDGKWGFIDKTGTIKIEPQFDGVHHAYGQNSFCEGLAAVGITEDGIQKWGYIDAGGAWVIEPQFGSAGEFSEGMAPVAEPGDSKPSGYINTSGTLVIPMQYEGGSGFSQGLAMVTAREAGYPSSFIDKTGATVLGSFDFALNFSEGLAYIEWGDRCGYIDKTGDRVIELPEGFGRCQHVSCCFSEEVALVESSDGEVERHGFIDTSGAWIIGPETNYFQDFSEGLAAAAVQKGGELKWGYIDKTGAWVIEPQYDMVCSFSEGLAAVMLLENDVVTYGYIDKTGKMVISPRRCTGAMPFSGGVAALTGLGSASDETPSYIDKTGKAIWQAQ